MKVVPFLTLLLCLGVSAQQTGRVLGVVTAVAPSGEITIKADTGGEIYAAKAMEGAKFLRVEPGEKDLTKAASGTAADVAEGDRILVRGQVMMPDRVVLATTLVVMKKDAIVSQNAKQEADWKKRSVTGVVKGLDPAAKQIRIAARTPGGIKEWTVAVDDKTSYKRYDDQSIRYQDAKPSALDAVQAGDQLRVLGNRDEPALRISGEQILFGSFQTLGGEIVSIKGDSGEIVMLDVQSKKRLTLKVSADAKLKKMPQFGGAGRGTAGGGRPAGAGGAAANGGGGAPGGMRGMNGGAPDLQQMFERMPSAALADLKAGDAIVASVEKPKDGRSANVIALIAGVDFLLRAAPSQVSQVLGNWNFEVGAP